MLSRCASCQRFALLFCLVLFLFTTACQQQQAPDTRAADEAAIRQTDVDWAKAAASKNVDVTVAFYSDDATVAPPNSPAVTDKKAIHDLWAALLGPDLVSITWAPTKIEVARSGDLAYLNGWYKMSAKDAKGNAVEEKGKMVEVWKKQSDGKWKCVSDIFNSDMPAPPPPSSDTKK
jgi:ketosteroid isomerase-like protein